MNRLGWQFLRGLTFVPFGFSVLFSMTFESSAFAQTKGAQKTPVHKAHEHGVAKAQCAADGKRMLLEFEAPAESMYGFERSPKDESEKKKVEAAVTLFSRSLSEMVQIQGVGECTWKTLHVNPAVADDPHSEHLEFRGSFEALCAQELQGKARIRLNFSKNFSGLKSVKIQCLSEGKQQGGTARSGKPLEFSL